MGLGTVEAFQLKNPGISPVDQPLHERGSFPNHGRYLVNWGLAYEADSPQQSSADSLAVDRSGTPWQMQSTLDWDPLSGSCQRAESPHRHGRGKGPV